MSNHDNHRRGERYRSEHGPRWENGDPGKGCNSTHVARARRGWKRIRARKERREGSAMSDVPDERARALHDAGMRDEAKDFAEERITSVEYHYLRRWYFAACPAAHREIDARRAVHILGKLLERLNTSREARDATMVWPEPKR